MDTAFLRIKFSPLLKHYSNKGERECVIEIIPEVSVFQNLENLDWKVDQNLIEYTIPVTYKIFIKKKIDSTESTLDKTYYSCVDLLQTTDDSFASGDVTRFTSDIYISKKVTSEVERCDIILSEKDLYAKTANLYRLKQRSKSSQTIDNTSNLNRFINDRSPMFESKVTQEIEPVNIENQNSLGADALKSSTRNDNLAGNNDHLHSFQSVVPVRMVMTKQTETWVSRSPIRSIRTNELPIQLPEIKDQKSDYMLQMYKSESGIRDFAQNMSTGDNKETPQINSSHKIFLLDNINDFPRERSPQHEKCLNDSKSKIFNEHECHSHKNAAALNNIVYEVKKYDRTKVDGDIKRKTTNFNNSNKKLPTLVELQNNEVSLQGDVEDEDSLVEIIKRHVKDKTILNKKSNKTVTYKIGKSRLYTNTDISLRETQNQDVNSTNTGRRSNDNIKTFLTLRHKNVNYYDNKLSQMRAIKLLQFMEREIYPLKIELNDIKNKCLSYGIFTSDTVPLDSPVLFNTISEQSTSHPSNKEEKKQNDYTDESQLLDSLILSNLKDKEQKRPKSNRVVYTILFNG